MTRVYNDIFNVDSISSFSPPSLPPPLHPYFLSPSFTPSFSSPSFVSISSSLHFVFVCLKNKLIILLPKSRESFPGRNLGWASYGKERERERDERENGKRENRMEREILIWREMWIRKKVDRFCSMQHYYILVEITFVRKNRLY